jgi:hypothetical protein
MPIETSAASGALIKIFGLPVLAGAAATSLGFIFMWPKTIREAFLRIACTIISSTVAGPALVIAAHAWWPNLFASAKAVAVMYGSDPALGFLFVGGPLMVLAGLPAWWVVGGVVLWFDRRRGKDIGELALDAAGIVKDVRGAL